MSFMDSSGENLVPVTVESVLTRLIAAGFVLGDRFLPWPERGYSFVKPGEDCVQLREAFQNEVYDSVVFSQYTRREGSVAVAYANSRYFHEGREQWTTLTNDTFKRLPEEIGVPVHIPGHGWAYRWVDETCPMVKEIVQDAKLPDVYHVAVNGICVFTLNFGGPVSGGKKSDNDLVERNENLLNMDGTRNRGGMNNFMYTAYNDTERTIRDFLRLLTDETLLREFCVNDKVQAGETWFFREISTVYREVYDTSPALQWVTSFTPPANETTSGTETLSLLRNHSIPEEIIFSWFQTKIAYDKVHELSISIELLQRENFSEQTLKEVMAKYPTIFKSMITQSLLFRHPNVPISEAISLTFEILPDRDTRERWWAKCFVEGRDRLVEHLNTTYDAQIFTDLPDETLSRYATALINERYLTDDGI